MGLAGDEHQGPVRQSAGVCGGERGLSGKSQAIKNRLG
jgi:hypothetical protein